MDLVVFFLPTLLVVLRYLGTVLRQPSPSVCSAC